MRFLGPGGSRPACRICSAPSRSRSLRRARTYTCVVPHPRPEGKKLNAGPEPEKRKPLDLLRFCRGRMKMKQQESGITRARKRVVVFFSTVQNLHGIAPTRKSKSFQLARDWHWHRARPIHGPLLVRPNCHFKRAPDSPRAVSDSRAA